MTATFVAVVLLLSLLLLSPAVFAASEAWHTASGIGQGAFEAGNFSFTGNLTVGSPSAARFFVDNSSGRVGIGTSIPTKLLHVQGDMNVTGNLSIADGSVTSPGLNFGNENNSGLYRVGKWNYGFSRLGSQIFTFMIGNSAAAMNFQGRIYLGSIGPDGGGWIDEAQASNPRFSMAGADSALYLNGSGAAIVTLVASGSSLLRFASVSGTPQYSVPGNGAGNFFFETDSDSFVGVGTINPNGTLHVHVPGNVNALVVNDSTGRVGIGTRSPSYQLEVRDTSANGTAANISGILYVNSTTRSVGIDVPQTTGNYILEVPKSAAINGTLFAIGGTAIGGSVGIGTNTTPFRLTVAGNMGANESPAFGTTTQINTTFPPTIGGGIGHPFSLAIGSDGLPVIAFNGNNNNLQVLHCGSSNCNSTGNNITTVDAIGNIQANPVMAIGTDGLPIIVYLEDAAGYNFKVVKCGNVACSEGNNVTTVVSGAPSAGNRDIAIGSDGLPVIAYNNASGDDINVLKCGNAACSAGNTEVNVDTTGNIGNAVHMAIAPDGLPIISYHDEGLRSLRVVKCGNINCSASNTITTLSASGTQTDGASFSSIAIGSDGLPIIAYVNDTTESLILIKCGNAACSTGNTNVTVDGIGNMGGNIGRHNSIAIGIDGLPLISYYNNSNGTLKVVKCGNLNCSSGNIITTVDAENNTGRFTSIVVDSDGLPIISYYDAARGRMKVLKCANTACSALSGTSFAGGSMLGSWKPNERSYGVPYRAVSTLAVSNPTTFTNLSFLVNGVERMTITPYGDIGIGTQAPSAKLHISGASLTGLALNVSGVLYVNHTNGRVGIGVVSPAYYLEVKDTAANGLTANISNTLYINATTGNVGINTTTPNQALHVAGSVNLTGNVSLRAPNGAVFTCGVDDNAAFRCSG